MDAEQKKRPFSTRIKLYNHEVDSRPIARTPLYVIGKWFVTQPKTFFSDITPRSDSLVICNSPHYPTVWLHAISPYDPTIWLYAISPHHPTVRFYATSNFMG